MKRTSTVFLQMVILLIGIAVFTFLLWEPHLEGVNKNATFFQVYRDLFIAYVYVMFIPFFISLYQAFRLLGYARTNQVFSPEAVKALRTIKYCALIMIGFVLFSFIFMVNADPDDRPPGVVMRVVLTFGAIVVATVAAMFERIFQNAVDMKSENDLTV